MQITFSPRGAHRSDAALGAAKPLTQTDATGASKLLIQALGANVRYRLDGGNPEAGVGFQLTPEMGEKLIPVGAATRVRVIAEGVGAEIQYQWGD